MKKTNINYRFFVKKNKTVSVRLTLTKLSNTLIFINKKDAPKDKAIKRFINKTSKEVITELLELGFSEDDNSYASVKAALA